MCICVCVSSKKLSAVPRLAVRFYKGSRRGCLGHGVGACLTFKEAGFSGGYTSLCIYQQCVGVQFPTSTPALGMVSPFSARFHTYVVVPHCSFILPFPNVR